MNHDIHTHLEKLKTELDKLEPAVKHLQLVDGNATALVKTFNGIHKDFQEHLSKIERSITEANKEHHRGIEHQIKDSVVAITEVTGTLKETFSSFGQTIEALIANYKNLAGETSRLLEKIDKIDFPTRLEKLDTTVSSINQGLQTIQQRLGDLERNLKDDFQAKTREVITKSESIEKALQLRMDSFEEKVDTEFEQMAAANKFLKVMLIISVGFSILLALLMIFNVKVSG